MKRLAVVVICLFLTVAVVLRPCAAQQQNDGESQRTTAQSKPIQIGVKVEAEGDGKGQGMWMQAANDLTPKELKTLETLVVGEMKKQDGVRIVPMDYEGDYIGIVVVAAKLPAAHSGNWYYIASSVVTIEKKSGTDELVTHDVVAESSLSSLARAIAYQFAVARFRAVTGLWK